MAIITNTARLGRLPVVVRPGDYQYTDLGQVIKPSAARQILAKRALAPFHGFIPVELRAAIPKVDVSVIRRASVLGVEERGTPPIVPHVVVSLGDVLAALERPIGITNHQVHLSELDPDTRAMFLSRVATPNQLRRLVMERTPLSRVELFSDLVDAGRKMKSLEPPKALLSALEGIQLYRLLKEIGNQQENLLPDFVDCVSNPHYEGLAANFRVSNGHVFPSFIRAAREQGNGATGMFFTELNRRTGNGITLAEMFRQLDEPKDMEYFWKKLSHPRKKEFVLALRLNSSAFKYSMLVAIAGNEVIKVIEDQLVKEGAIVKLQAR